MWTALGRDISLGMGLEIVAGSVLNIDHTVVNLLKKKKKRGKKSTYFYNCLLMNVIRNIILFKSLIKL